MKWNHQLSNQVVSVLKLSTETLRQIAVEGAGSRNWLEKKRKLKCVFQTHLYVYVLHVHKKKRVRGLQKFKFRSSFLETS